MKKTFLVRRNALFDSTDISWGMGALACAVAVLLVRLIAPNFFWYVFTPLFRSADALASASNGIMSGFKNASILAAQNEDLANKNAMLSIENESLTQKANELSAIIGSSGATKGISAGVIARPPQSPYDTLVIGVGSAEGAEVGQEVFGEGSVPLGAVATVSTHFSRVILFSAPGLSTNAWAGKTNIPITIIGEGAGVMSASVARTTPIEVGDVVFVPGPGKLPIGVVTRIDGDPSSPHVVIRITPTLNMFSTAWVELRDIGTKLFVTTATSTL